jgi:hypothetical protein
MAVAINCNNKKTSTSNKTMKSLKIRKVMAIVVYSNEKTI